MSKHVLRLRPTHPIARGRTGLYAEFSLWRTFWNSDIQISALTTVDNIQEATVFELKEVKKKNLPRSGRDYEFVPVTVTVAIAEKESA